jgi:hypothetical protein
VEKRDPELARSAVGFWVVAETRKRPEKAYFAPKKVDFTLKTRVFSTRILRKYIDDKRVNADLHQNRGTFFCFSRKSRDYETGFVVLIWRRGADFWRRLAGPEKLRWKMHGLSMRVSG